MSGFNNYGERNAVLLEGMYKGLSKEIDGLRTAVGQELRISETHQTSQFRALTESIAELLQEVRFLSQQNSAIHDADDGRFERPTPALGERCSIP